MKTVHKGYGKTKAKVQEAQKPRAFKSLGTLLQRHVILYSDMMGQRKEENREGRSIEGRREKVYGRVKREEMN